MDARWIAENLLEHGRDRPWVTLYDGPEIAGEPVIAGQIVKPSEISVTSFQVYYGSILDDYCDRNFALRVLEIGAGMGNCSYGFIRSYSPELYIATEPFTSLLPTLRSNLDDWGYQFPRGIAAAYDCNYKSILPLGAVNVIIGNSVLHHITHWKEFLDNAIDMVDDDGILVFGEPNNESWVFIITLIRILIMSKPLTAQSKARLLSMVKGLEYRLSNKNNVDVLSKLEDKHIFSFKELSEFASSRGMLLKLSKRPSNFRKIFLAKIASCLMGEDDRALVDEFLAEGVTPFIDDTTLGDPFLVFSMSKQCMNRAGNM